MDEILKLKIPYWYELNNDIKQRIHTNYNLFNNLTADKPDEMFYSYKKYLINYVLVLKTFLDNSSEFLHSYERYNNNIQIFYEHIEKNIQKEDVIIGMASVLNNEFKFTEFLDKIFMNVNANREVENNLFLDILFSFPDNS